VDAWNSGLGTTQLQQDRIEEGLDALRRAEHLAPENQAVVAALASVYRLAGESTESITYYQRLATMAPSR